MRGAAPPSRAIVPGLVAGLLGLTLAVYLQTGSHDFVRFDDPSYLTENPHVLAGWTLDGAKWAFTTGHMANWHPLTWLSHMLDVELFGMDAGRHHLAGAALHGLNTVLLFLVLHAATGSRWRSGLVAALFSAHPLHVESVAWAAERKDLLCALFWLLSTGAYIAWSRTRRRSWYVAAAAFLALALLAKPMAVTAPLTFLLLDYWPLRRLAPPAGIGETAQCLPLRTLLAEKAPFFLLSAASSLATVVAQRGGGAVRDFEPYPLGVRLANAALSYAGYLRKTALPFDLSVYYPHPWDVRGSLPWPAVAWSTLLLAVVTTAAIRYARRFPPLFAGWAWYVLTLTPVIGIVQVGDQAMADRYTYVPLVGVFIILAWGGEGLFRKWEKVPRAIPAAAAAAVVVAAAILAHGQAGYWKDSPTLFRRALAVTTGNWVIHYNLGCGLQAQGNHAEAVAHFRETLKVRPTEPSALNNLGFSLSRLGDPSGAVAAYRRAVEVKPDYVEARTNLGNALLRQGSTKEAIAQFRQALAVRPGDGIARLALATALAQAGPEPEAETEFLELLRREPENADAHNDLGVLLARQKRENEALRHFREAFRIAPEHPDAAGNLRKMLDILNARGEKP